MTTEELRRLLQAATPGPWHTGNIELGDLIYSPSGTLIAETRLRIPEDAALIAAAVNALPALLDVVDAASSINIMYQDKTLDAALDALDALREVRP
jgi:hypothetical protein